MFEEENAKEIIDNLLSASPALLASEDVMQQRGTRDRKPTEKGRLMNISMLQQKRDAAYKRMAKQIKRINSSYMTCEDIEWFSQERDNLDQLKEDFHQAFTDYHELMLTEQETDASYRWFDLKDREYQDFRLKISGQIHALEKEAAKQHSVKSYRSGTSRTGSTKTSHVSNSSARSRKIKAAAKAAKLEAQMKFLDKEAELRRLTCMKELAMARAERDAMKSLEEEEQERANKLEEATPKMVPVRSKLNEDAPPFVPMQSGPPAKTEVKFKASPNLFAPPLSQESPQPRKFECRSDTPLNPFHTPSPKPRGVSVKTEPRTYDSPFSALTPTPPGPSQTPAIEERHSSWPVNPFLSPVLKSEVEIAPPSPSEKALQEIIKLQAKQTELSALIAQQQRVSSLPVQEPPIFSGNYFDYPIFTRAFETIIESRVPSDRERLYFLNKYTEGKANDVIKGFVTLNSDDSYQRAKNLLAQRYGDPHRVSDAYKSRLKEWPQISEGDSNGLQALSDFLGQCEEAMRSIHSLNELNSTEVLRQVSSKLPSYSGVKWFRHAFDKKKKDERTITFHDLVKFVRAEADLATDPVFSPDVLKMEKKKSPEKQKTGINRRRPPSLNSLATTGEESKGNWKSPTGEKTDSKLKCPACSKSHMLYNCEEFKKKDIRERHDFVKLNSLCFGCLQRGHLSKDCKRRPTCQECKKPHPTTLHYETKKQAKEPQKAMEKEDSSIPAISNCSSTDSQRVVINSLIVPVWLHHKDSPKREIMTYALLDEASDTTFIKSEVLKNLGPKGPEVKLNLSTMLGRQEIPVEKISGLVVETIDERVKIELLKTYDQIYLSEETKFRERRRQMSGNTFRRSPISCIHIKVVWT